MIKHRSKPAILAWLAPHNAEVTGAGAQRREPKAPRFWRPVDRLVKGRLPIILYWHPMLNADSRYCVSTRLMAPGTRAPNARNMLAECAGLPRDLNTERAAKTAARPATVFCPKTAAIPRPNTKPKNTGARPLTLAACAPTEWSRRRNVVGVAVPALVMGFREITATRLRGIKGDWRIFS